MTALVIRYDPSGTPFVEIEEVDGADESTTQALGFVRPWPAAIQRRVQYLLHANSDGRTTNDERAELEAYVEAGLDSAVRVLEQRE